jgi:YVTN family beta-propeller protein
MKLNIALLLCLISLSISAQQLPDPFAADAGRIALPYDRFIQPAGLQIPFGDASQENHAMDAALSPDGKWLAVMERYSIVFISTADNKVAFILRNIADPRLSGGMNTYSGIQWYRGAEGTEVFWSIVGRFSKSYVVSARWDGVKAEFSKRFEYMPENDAATALPNELLIRKEGKKEVMYVILNGNNKVIKQNLPKGDTIWVTDPGVAPYGLTMAAGKLYVTNWAGRHPQTGDSEVAGVPWGLAKVNNMQGGGTREGSVTVINPADGRIIKEILVGLHPNEIISDKTGKQVFVTNSNSDNVSVISTKRDVVEETVSVRLQPEINPFFGDSPNGLCLSKDEKTLYVANGMDNALAIINLKDKQVPPGKNAGSKVTGFIPTGAYPSSITIASNNDIYVTNLEAAGARIGLKNNSTTNIVYNSHNMMASVSMIPSRELSNLTAYTDTVIALNNLSRSLAGRETPRPDAVARPVPERIGEPSHFKHVVYIIKENRTYDQILGDMKQGDGDPALCIYGEEVTPNTHKLAEEFLLLDNFHVSGKCSAEGHQWTDAAIVTDYIEKNMRAWFRSYPHAQTDALVYAPSGFLWDNALKHGRSVKIYGEASLPDISDTLTWTKVYKMYRAGQKVEFTNHTTIDPVRPILSQTYPSYGSNVFTDVMRADALIKELQDYEKMDGDNLPGLMIAALPNDHTAGVRPGIPTPRAMVADNDYALGKIVEAFSKSRFWSNTVIFVVEDDSQSGWDHVSAYRTVALVISPYSRLRNTVHTYYTQPSMVRTIEQILGMPPMNIQDAIAPPMFSCFTSTPDKTPYTAIPNRIPLDEMNPPLRSLTGKAKYFAEKSMLPEFDGIDKGDDDLLNRILWFAARGKEPYPAHYAGIGNKDEDDEDEYGK